MIAGCRRQKLMTPQSVFMGVSSKFNGFCIKTKRLDAIFQRKILNLKKL